MAVEKSVIVLAMDSALFDDKSLAIAILARVSR